MVSLGTLVPPPCSVAEINMIAIIKRARFVTSRFVTVHRRGVLYDLGGEDVELFTLRVLAEALDRSRDTLLAWEGQGLLPRPLFRVGRRPRTKHDGPWRLYSGTQIVNANALALHYFGRRRRIDDRSQFTAFAEELRKVWFSPTTLANNGNAAHPTFPTGGFSPG